MSFGEKNARTDQTNRETQRYPWLVVRTAFHGGGIVSRHRYERTANAAALRYASKHCECGCAGVVAAADYDSLPVHSEVSSPYALAW